MGSKAIGRGWRWMLWAAAGYNWLIGLPLLIGPTGAPADKVTALLITAFGLLYALVARDVARLAPVLWVGVFGKLGIIALLGPAVLAGTAPAGTGPILAGDLAFTLGFLALLLQRR